MLVKTNKKVLPFLDTVHSLFVLRLHCGLSSQTALHDLAVSVSLFGKQPKVKGSDPQLFLSVFIFKI